MNILFCITVENGISEEIKLKPAELLPRAIISMCDVSFKLVLFYVNIHLFTGVVNQKG